MKAFFYDLFFPIGRQKQTSFIVRIIIFSFIAMITFIYLEYQQMFIYVALAYFTTIATIKRLQDMNINPIITLIGVLLIALALSFNIGLFIYYPAYYYTLALIIVAAFGKSNKYKNNYGEY